MGGGWGAGGLDAIDALDVKPLSEHPAASISLSLPCSMFRCCPKPRETPLAGCFRPLERGSAHGAGLSSWSGAQRMERGSQLTSCPNAVALFTFSRATVAEAVSAHDGAGSQGGRRVGEGDKHAAASARALAVRRCPAYQGPSTGLGPSPSRRCGGCLRLPRAGWAAACPPARPAPAHILIQASPT